MSSGDIVDFEPRAFQIDELSVVYQAEEGGLPAVRDVSLTLAPRQTLGLVGESGSGKTTLALGAIGYLPANGRVVNGAARLRDTDLLALSRRQMRQVWGSRIGLVSQNPQGALNPTLTVGRQLDEMGRRHLGLGRRAARESTLDMLRRVDMPDPRSVVERYPHQLSGGMLQRSAIAMALLTSPELLILDEPTTALDVTTQAMVLDLLDELKAEFNSAILHITHNLGVVSRICDRVAIMYAGEIFEEAASVDLFAQPLHPYTLNLLHCVPRFEAAGAGRGVLGGVGVGAGAPAANGGAAGMRLPTIPGSLPRLDDLPSGCTFAPRCPLALDVCRTSRPLLTKVADGRSTACVRWQLLLTEDGRRAAISLPETAAGGTMGPGAIAPDGGPRSPHSQAEREDPGAHLLEARDMAKVFSSPGSRAGTRAVDGVTVWVDPGRTLGLVGESGSGKTTLARLLTGLSPPSHGNALIDGSPVGAATADRSRAVLRRLQMVFQNPEASLNPRRTVGQSITRPLVILDNLDRVAATRRAHELLAAVRLSASYFHRYPAELSGGERQRVAIARAFAAGPDLVVCDEPISSLDVSVQGSLMNLLVDLQEEQRTAYLFISHDVTAVQHLSHRIAVMYLGRLMEEGTAARVLAPPYHPYTEALLSAIPVPDPAARRPRIRLRAGAPATSAIPAGCRFHPRCPRYLGAICQTEEPPWRTAAAIDHSICCHIPLDELTALQEAE
jgi:peptide/nickel transport system ATP-binding protein